MLHYITVRFLSIIPALFTLSLLVFFLRSGMPDEIAEDQINEARIQNVSLTDEDFIAIMKHIRYELKVDLPIFYFSINSAILPDSLNRIYPIQNGSFLKQLLLRYGAHQSTLNYYSYIVQNLISENQVQQSTARNLFDIINEDEIAGILNGKGGESTESFRALVNALVANKNEYQYLIPEIRWHGTSNQFHSWFKSLLRLDLGKSSVNNEPVISMISRALSNTLLISIPALLLIAFISIPLGIWLSSKPHDATRSIVRTALFALDAIPLFWLALMLIILFASGVFMNILPAYGMAAFQNYSDYPLLAKVSYLILPITSMTLTGIGYLSIQVTKAMSDQHHKLYILAARARGLTESRIRWVHIFRNALIPIITIFISYLSAAFVGSLVVEVIFSIPGMGKLLFDSVLARDFNVIIGIVLLTGLIKMLVNILGDITYKIVNPATAFQP